MMRQVVSFRRNRLLLVLRRFVFSLSLLLASFRLLLQWEVRFSVAVKLTSTSLFSVAPAAASSALPPPLPRPSFPLAAAGAHPAGRHASLASAGVSRRSACLSAAAAAASLPAGSLWLRGSNGSTSFFDNGSITCSATCNGSNTTRSSSASAICSRSSTRNGSSLYNSSSSSSSCTTLSHSRHGSVASSSVLPRLRQSTTALPEIEAAGRNAVTRLPLLRASEAATTASSTEAGAAIAAAADPEAAATAGAGKNGRRRCSLLTNGAAGFPHAWRRPHDGAAVKILHISALPESKAPAAATSIGTSLAAGGPPGVAAAGKGLPVATPKAAGADPSPTPAAAPGIFPSAAVSASSIAVSAAATSPLSSAGAAASASATVAARQKRAAQCSNSAAPRGVRAAALRPYLPSPPPPPPLLLLQLPLRVLQVRLTLTPTAAPASAVESLAKATGEEAAAEAARTRGAAAKVGAPTKSFQQLLSRRLLPLVPLLLGAGGLLLLLMLRTCHWRLLRYGRTTSSCKIRDNRPGNLSACAAARAAAAATLADEVLCVLQPQIQQLTSAALAYPALGRELWGSCNSSDWSSESSSNSSGDTHSDSRSDNNSGSNSCSNVEKDSSISGGRSSASNSRTGDSSTRDSGRGDGSGHNSSSQSYSCRSESCSSVSRIQTSEDSSRKTTDRRSSNSNNSLPERPLRCEEVWREVRWGGEDRLQQRHTEERAFYSSVAAAYGHRLLYLWQKAQHLLEERLQQQHQQRSHQPCPQLPQQQQQSLQAGLLGVEQVELEHHRRSLSAAQRGWEKERHPQHQRQHLAQQESRLRMRNETATGAAREEVDPLHVEHPGCCSRFSFSAERSSSISDVRNCSSGSRSSSRNGGSCSGDSSSVSKGVELMKSFAAYQRHRAEAASALSCPVAVLAKQLLQERFRSLAAEVYRGLLLRLNEELVQQFSREFACLVGGTPAFDRQAARLRCTYTTLHRMICAAAVLPVGALRQHLLQPCSRHAARAACRNDSCVSSWRWWSWCSICRNSSFNSGNSNSSNSSCSNDSVCMDCATEQFAGTVQRLIEDRSSEGVALKEAAAAVESLQVWKVVQCVAQLAAARLLPLLLQLLANHVQERIRSWCSRSRDAEIGSKWTTRSSVTAATSAATPATTTLAAAAAS